MTPRAFRSPLNLALLLVICAVILSARLLLSDAHVENVPPAAAVDVPLQGEDLPPVW